MFIEKITSLYVSLLRLSWTPCLVGLLPFFCQQALDLSAWASSAALRSTFRTSLPVNDKLVVQGEFDIIGHSRVKVSLGLAHVGTRRPPTPEPGDAIDMGIDSKLIPFHANAHEAVQAFRSQPAVRHDLLGNVVICPVEQEP